MQRSVCFLLALSPFVLGADLLNREPYHVSVENSGKHICSGALIGPKTILTAASCIRNAKAVNLKVRAGTQKLEDGGVLANANNLIPHPRYMSSRKDFDLALIILTQPFSLGKNINTIALPKVSTVAPAAGTTMELTGWGITESDKKDLQKVTVTVSVPIKCKNSYASFIIYITERMFCASHSNPNCKADPGSPLVSNNVLQGVSAWEQSCGSSRYPGIYTNVASLRKWIDSQSAV